MVESACDGDFYEPELGQSASCPASHPCRSLRGDLLYGASAGDISAGNLAVANHFKDRETDAMIANRNTA
jgi:hypothetical protein